MAIAHDPFGHVDRLRQALESGRRPIGLFLSAGCPMAVEDGDGTKPLIPDVPGMTKELTRRLEASEHSEAFSKVQVVYVRMAKKTRISSTC